MEPEKLGYIMAVRGQLRKDCPYAVGSLHWDNWDRGFSKGLKDLENATVGND